MSDIRLLPPEERTQLGALLNHHSPADAIASYYALDHPPDRVELFVDTASNGTARAFLALAQTGLDLFRRLAVPFAANPLGLARLIRAGLRPQRPAMLLLPVEQEGWLGDLVELSERRVSDLYRLHPSSFTPIPNVLAVSADTPGGGRRFEIRSASGSRAAAGENWQGSRYAEVYLEADEEARARGFSRSVLAAMAGALLADHRVALYRIDQQDAASQAEAHEVGFRRTGDRYLLAQAVLRDNSPQAGR